MFDWLSSLSFPAMLAILTIFSIVSMLVYAIPSFVAVQRDHDQKGVIIAINFLVGWTVIGWIASLVMSLRD